MDLQEILNNSVAAMRAESFKKSDQLTVGEMILKLEAIGIPGANVEFDFNGAVPCSLDSWRGSYVELALSYDESDGFKAGELLRELKESIGKKFYGYKGGEFLMGRTTPVWVVSDRSDSGHTGVVDIVKDGHKIVIKTAQCEY